MPVQCRSVVLAVYSVLALAAAVVPSPLHPMVVLALAGLLLLVAVCVEQVVRGIRAHRHPDPWS
jgi:hypothetical protein